MRPWRATFVLYGVDITTYGAIGNDSRDCTAAIQAAITAAGALGGKGHVIVPPGIFRCTDELVLPSNGVPIIFQGYGRQISQLKWPSDLGAGKYGIKAATGGSTTYNAIRDMRLVGPNTTAGLAEDPASMCGIRLLEKWELTACNVQGFHTGLYFYGDHIVCQNTFSNGNYYGAFFPSGMPTDGNNAFLACNLTGNTLASVGLGVNGRMAGCLIVDTHMGFSPFGIYLEGGTTGGVIGCEWNSTSQFESVGNAAIYDAGSNNIVSNILPSWTYSATYYWSSAPQLKRAAFDGYTFNSNIFRFGNQQLGLPDMIPGTTSVIYCAGGVNSSTANIVEMGHTVPNLCATAGLPLVAAATPGAWNLNNTWVGSQGEARGIFLVASETIARYDALQCTNAGGAKVAASTKPFGVALNAAATNGVVPVCTRGYSPGGVTVGSAVSTNDLLAPHGSTAGSVKTAVAGDYVLGLCLSGASSGQALVYINPYKI